MNIAPGEQMVNMTVMLYILLLIHVLCYMGVKLGLLLGDA